MVHNTPRYTHDELMELVDWFKELVKPIISWFSDVLIKLGNFIRHALFKHERAKKKYQKRVGLNKTNYRTHKKRKKHGRN